MTNIQASWTQPRPIAGRIIVYHDPAQDGIENEHIICETDDQVVEKTRELMNDGLLLGHDFAVLADPKNTGLTDRLRELWLARAAVV